MNAHEAHTAASPLWPFWVYGALVLIAITAIITISYFLGQRHKERATGQPYESGIVGTGETRIRFSAQFYLVAMMFVIFDVEAVFIVLWALAFKDLGWPGYFAMLVFIALLAAVLVYEWVIGALDFGPNGKKILKAYHQLKAKKDSI